MEGLDDDIVGGGNNKKRSADELRRERVSSFEVGNVVILGRV